MNCNDEFNYNSGSSLITSRTIYVSYTDVSAFSSSGHFGHSLKVEPADVTSDLIKAVLDSKVP
jgi:hypothetical protein